MISKICKIAMVWVSFVLLFGEGSALAADRPDRLFEIAVCPEITEEYAGLLAKLDDIQTAIRGQANCDSVSLKVKSLEDLFVSQRQKLNEIIEAGKTADLTQEQSEFVRQYAEDVTTKVASLYDLIGQGNQCFSGDKADKQLGNLAGFINEAARLTAALSGPYGTPIALAGNVVAGFLTGLEQIRKTRAGYDYSKPEKWRSYVQNLCTFHSYHEQIEHLLDPVGRLRQLKELKSKLDAQVERFKPAAEGPKINKNPAPPLDESLLVSQGLRRWVIGEIKRVQADANSQWAKVSGRNLLAQANVNLEQFLVNREGPRFLQYQTNLSADMYAKLESSWRQESPSLMEQLRRLNVAWFPTRPSYWTAGRDYFRLLMFNTLDWNSVAASPEKDDARYSWATYRDQGIMRLQTAEAALEVVQGFCAFFRDSGRYTPEIRFSCTNSLTIRLASEQSQLLNDLEAAHISPTGSTLNPRIFSGDGEYAAKAHNHLELIQRRVDAMDLTAGQH
jgi:hypothetical protein